MLLECHLSALRTLMESLNDLVNEEEKPSTYGLSREYVHFLGDELERLKQRKGLSLDEAVSFNLHEDRAFADGSLSPRRWIVRGWTGTRDSHFRYADARMNPTDEVFVPTCHQYFLKTFEMHHERRRIQPIFAPSRREQRRVRKAAKNLVMFKTAGRRSWTDNKGVLYSSKAGVERMAQNGDDALSTAQQYKDGPKLYLHSKLRHLREPSGFVAMSRVADGLRK